MQGEGALSSVFLEPIVANTSEKPCAAETNGLLGGGGGAPLNGQTLDLPSSLGTVRVLYASTDWTEHPDATDPSRHGRSSAEAGVAEITLTIPSLPTIKAEVLTSSASAVCDDTNSNDPNLSSNSEVLKVTVGTTVIEPIAGPQTVDLGPLGKLYLNHVSGNGTDTVTARALYLDTTLVDVAVAESTAGFDGHPCTPGTTSVPQCSDGIDNDGDGTIDFGTGANNDPGCSSADDDDETSQCADGIDNDGDSKTDFGTGAGNDPGCSSAADNDETSQCDDAIDNGDPEDTLIDEGDPGCHSDGDPNNAGSYEPWDNDETDGGGGGGAECSDGVDNDDAEDDLADAEDPDCHTDFDPENEDSYDPEGSESCDEIPADTEEVRDDRSDNPNDPEDDFGEPDDEDCGGSERGQDNGD